MSTKVRYGDYITVGQEGGISMPQSAIKNTWKVTDPPPYLVFLATKNGKISPTNTSFRNYESLTGSTHGHGLINACVHEKVEYENSKYDVITKGTGSDPQWTWKRGVQATPFSLVGYHHPHLAPAEEYGMSQEAWATLQPEFKSGLSLTNTLIELKDFKKIVKVVRSGVSGIANAARNFARRDSSLVCAELQLQYDFNLKPTVGVIAQISDLIPDFSGALERFNAKGSIPHRRYYKLKFGESETVEGSKLIKFSGEYIVGGTTTFRQEADAFGGHMLQYYGVTLSPAQIWEAIPFSFLIDYVFTVGRSLELLSKSACSTVHWSDFCASTKTSIEVVSNYSSTYVQYFNGGCGPVNSVGYPIAVSRSQIYTRWPTKPPFFTGVSLPRFKQPSIGNLVDSLALLRSGVGWKR